MSKAIEELREQKERNAKLNGVYFTRIGMNMLLNPEGEDNVIEVVSYEELC